MTKTRRRCSAKLAIPFPPGAYTPESVKALLLDLDDPDEGPLRIRRGLETRTAYALRRAFEKWLAESFPSTLTADEARIAALHITTPQELRDALERGLIDASDLGVSVAIDGMAGIGFDFTLAMTEAREAARAYTYTLIQGIENTTRRAVGEAVARWVENGEPLESLIGDLEPLFGRRRAQMIAATETTRAYQMGAEASYRASGVVGAQEWRTARDERVCPVCGPRHGMVIPLGGRDVPPAHPNCRCWTAPVLTEIGA